MVFGYLSDVANVGYAIGKNIKNDPKVAMGAISSGLVLILGCQQSPQITNEEILSTLRAPSPYANATHDPSQPSAKLDEFKGLDCYPELKAHYDKSQESGFQNSPDYDKTLSSLKDDCISEKSGNIMQDMIDLTNQLREASENNKGFSKGLEDPPNIEPKK